MPLVASTNNLEGTELVIGFDASDYFYAKILPKC